MILYRQPINEYSTSVINIMLFKNMLLEAEVSIMDHISSKDSMTVRGRKGTLTEVVASRHAQLTKATWDARFQGNPVS